MINRFLFSSVSFYINSFVFRSFFFLSFFCWKSQEVLKLTTFEMSLSAVWLTNARLLWCHQSYWSAEGPKTHQGVKKERLAWGIPVLTARIEPSQKSISRRTGTRERVLCYKSDLWPSARPSERIHTDSRLPREKWGHNMSCNTK